MSCPTDYSPLVVAPGKSWSDFVVVTTLVVDSKVGIVGYWSAKEWREFCHPSRANEAPQPRGWPAWCAAGLGVLPKESKLN
jgi:hypothetical protein